MSARAKVRTHTHHYDRHPNPAWSTHLACVHCGFAIPRSAWRHALNAGATIATDTTREPAPIKDYRPTFYHCAGCGRDSGTRETCSQCGRSIPDASEAQRVSKHMRAERLRQGLAG